MKSTESRQRADRLLQWLNALPDGAPLPRMMDIGRQLNFSRAATAYYACLAFDMLARRGVIVTRSGSRSEARGHRIVRLTATGREHATVGCPFTLNPPDAGARRAA
jgi:hypothetical protein